jgi:pimeloyl-ACP methyl ester carboxylesterase
MCVHPQGYVMSFAHAAAEHGVVIGLQGDLTCNGEPNMSRWSYDIERTNRRIDDAFAAAGEPAPTDAIAIGLSQGADLAEKLAARWPQKYTRVILIASPLDPKPHTAKAVLMAGNYDISNARMRAAATKLGPNATFISLGNAYHGQLGPTPNASLGAAIEFVTAP